MIKFIFYTLFAYLLIKLFRVFLDPMLAGTTKNTTNTTRNSTSQAHTPSEKPKQKEQVLGEYIEYEEVRN